MRTLRRKRSPRGESERTIFFASDPHGSEIWDTHREHPEEEIRAHLKAMTDRMENPGAAIFNIHVPPYNSRLDTAPLLGRTSK